MTSYLVGCVKPGRQFVHKLSFSSFPASHLVHFFSAANRATSPVEHLIHSVCPFVPIKKPSGQSWQNVTLQETPSSHLTKGETFRPFLPVGHPVHVLASASANRSVNSPIEQTLQSSGIWRPSLSEYRPRGQWMQSLASSAAVVGPYNPLTHFLHCIGSWKKLQVVWLTLAGVV